MLFLVLPVSSLDPVSLVFDALQNIPDDAQLVNSLHFIHFLVSTKITFCRKNNSIKAAPAVVMVTVSILGFIKTPVDSQSRMVEKRVSRPPASVQY